MDMLGVVYTRPNNENTFNELSEEIKLIEEYKNQNSN